MKAEYKLSALWSWGKSQRTCYEKIVSSRMATNVNHLYVNNIMESNGVQRHFQQYFSCLGQGRNYIVPLRRLNCLGLNFVKYE
jgi:hypothetical protein